MSFVDVNGKPFDIGALMSKAHEHRAINGTGKKPRKATVLNGYAAQPGTGPAGKTCRDCQHKQTVSNTGAKSWIKCLLRKSTWTNGPGTDIRASSPACQKFAAKEGA